MLQELQSVEIALAKLELLVKESEDSGQPGSDRLRADLDKIRSLKQDVEVLKASLKYKASAKELRILEFQVSDIISGLAIVLVELHIASESCSSSYRRQVVLRIFKYLYKDFSVVDLVLLVFGAKGRTRDGYEQ